jgi:hypothetical protein
MAPRDAAREYHECCAAVGRAKLGSVDGLEAYNEAAGAVVRATDPAGLTLFAGWSAEPLVDDPAGRAMQLTAVLRELRGSAHIVALLAEGVRPAVAHVIKRPGDATTFGWDPAPEATDADRANTEAAETLTDQLLVPSYSVLDDDQAAALAGGIQGIAAALS